MADSWKRALNAFSYPANLSDYDRRHEFPGFFEITIIGDRFSTIAFENHYQETAPTNIAAYFEVVYWKLYSQANKRKNGTDRIVDFVQGHGITPMELWHAVHQFVENKSVNNLQRIRKLLGITTNVLAVPLTLPALASPKAIPMIDRQVAKWVNDNALNHNINRLNKLTPFNMNFASLRQNGFTNYLNWVVWCQEVAQVLTKLLGDEWRARDVEMAVFTAQRNGIPLNLLP